MKRVVVTKTLRATVEVDENADGCKSLYDIEMKAWEYSREYPADWWDIIDSDFEVDDV